MTNQAGDVQQTYKILVKQRRFAEIAKLIQSSKTQPADFIIRAAYKQYIEEEQAPRVRLFYIMKLKDLTKIPPDAAILQETCKMALGMETPEILEAVSKRLEINKDVFKGMDKVLQTTYTTYVDEGKFVDLARLMEITGLKPKEEIIQKGYEKYLEEGKFISFSGLKKRTGVKPNETFIHEMYEKYNYNYLKNKKTNPEQAQEWMDRIKKLKRISKVPPPKSVVIEDLEM